jgi:hypothetical protein
MKIYLSVLSHKMQKGFIAKPPGLNIRFLWSRVHYFIFLSRLFYTSEQEHSL